MGAGKTTGDKFDENEARRAKQSLRLSRRNGARWLMHPSFEDVVQTLENTAGFRIYQENLRDGNADRFLGFPVEYSEVMPSRRRGGCGRALRCLGPLRPDADGSAPGRRGRTCRARPSCRLPTARLPTTLTRPTARSARHRARRLQGGPRRRGQLRRPQDRRCCLSLIALCACSGFGLGRRVERSALPRSPNPPTALCATSSCSFSSSAPGSCHCAVAEAAAQSYPGVEVVALDAGDSPEVVRFRSVEPDAPSLADLLVAPATPVEPRRFRMPPLRGSERAYPAVMNEPLPPSTAQYVDRAPPRHLARSRA